MSGAQKYSTFGGVFTPSILTILGVIMYMRLPWIVGHAGLWMTIAIIIIAHVISITTGLSVASIATDKKVKAGGVYYIISRSLGLPIGGTIGIALFIGMSFSISLYIIGFAESLLPYLDMAKNPYNIRLSGSVSLFLVAIITIISTSLAMKTQYFIMAAIVLSLASIFAYQGNTTITLPQFKTISSTVPFAKLFGVFFPAVTGFTAGVSMSGDLKDPRRSIPLGTIASIITGLVVYLTLATFLAWKVDAGKLQNDTQILESISVFPPFILAGIWGATISSSIGSVLGAPRVLQATSVDRITPRFFAKGYGQSSEPRNALILTILIAEAGILIGELDIIARIVSMFYITAYGFLNISCVVESWVSPDFRPDFKIPKWIGLVGTITSLIVMIQLDLLAMIGATLLMLLLFFYIKSRELNLEGGDTLTSIWSSVVRYGLYNLSKDSIHERNWRPNILLFSGGTDSRPYLVELSRSLADRRGIITNFHLAEKKELEQVTRSFIIDKEVKEFEGVFSRKIECNDVYEEMVQIARYHGFSGIEPNTVFLGRARSLTNAEKFASLIRNLESMDYNVLMLDYNKEHGFGKKQNVDIWWSGHGNNLSFALSLVRFLQTSLQWSEANYRFLMISNDKLKMDSIYMRIETILNDYRIRGTVKVVYNHENQKPFFDIIQDKSKDSDLTLLGLPDYHREDAISIGKKIGHFSKNLKSILWLKASGYFRNLSITANIANVRHSENKALVKLEFGKQPHLQMVLSGFAAELETNMQRYFETYFSNLFLSQEALLNRIKEIVHQKYQSTGNEDNNRAQEILTQVSYLVDSYLKTELPRNLETFQSFPQKMFQYLKQLTTGLPRRIKLYKNKSDLSEQEWQQFQQHPLRYLRSINKDYILYKPLYAKVIIYYLQKNLSGEFKRLIESITFYTISWVEEVYRILASINELELIDDKKEQEEKVTKSLVQVEKFISEIDENREDTKYRILNSVRQSINQSSDLLQTIHCNQKIKELKIQSSKNHLVNVEARVQNFIEITNAISSILDYGTRLLFFQEQLALCLLENLEVLRLDILKKTEPIYQATKESLAKIVNNKEETPGLDQELYDFEFEPAFYILKIQRDFNHIIQNLPVSIEVLNQSTLQRIQSGDIARQEIISIPIRKYVEHIVDTIIIPEASKPLENSLSIRVFNFAQETRELKENILDLSIKDKTRRKTALKKQVENSIEELNTKMSVFQKGILETFREVESILRYEFPRTNIYYLIRQSESLGYLVRKTERKRFYNRLMKKYFKYFTGVIVKFIYGKSRAFIFSSFFSPRRERLSKAGELSSWVRTNTIPAHISNSLPFYYKNIFLKKEAFSKESFRFFEKDIARIKNILAEDNNGILLIHGLPNSGKTWFAKNIVNKFFNKEKIITVDPKNIPHRNILSFFKLIAKQKGQRISKNNFQASLEQVDAILIDDFELFWNRNEEVNKILQEIFNFLRESQKKIVFIITINSFSYDYLKKTTLLSNYILYSIEVKPISARKLMDLILTKHKTTGYSLSINGVEDDEITPLTLARFFDRIFIHSGGYIGQALRSWILSIENAGKSVIYLSEKLNPSALSSIDLEPLWEMMLLQIVLHKVLDRAEIAKIDKNEQAIEHALEGMLRMKLIQIRDNQYLEINPDLQTLIIHKLIQKEYL